MNQQTKMLTQSWEESTSEKKKTMIMVLGP